MKTTLKDWPKVYRKLNSLSGMTLAEKIGFARCQAATPDERWEMNVNCIKALGLGGRVRSVRELERRKEELRRRESPLLWRLRRSDEELRTGRLHGAHALGRCE